MAVATHSQHDHDASERAFRQGLHHYTEGGLEDARVAFAECVQLGRKLSPPRERTDCATNLGSVLIDLGGEENEAHAEQLYRAVLTAEPANSDAAFNLALLLEDRRSEEALREAATLYLEVVAADERRWDAWANLASVLSNLKDRPIGAARAYQRAIVEIERTHEAHEASGGEPDPAEIEALAKLYYGLGMQLAEFSPTLCAQFAAEPDALLVGTPESAEGGAASGAYDRLCAENAQNALRTALALDPDHDQAEHMLAAMLASDAAPDAGGGGGGGGGAPTISKASAGYVKALFDDFSESFDTKLAELGYAVPALLGRAVAAYVQAERGGAPFASALDAGCGTGLAGPHLRPLVRGTLSGVDLSTKMLGKAAALTKDGAPATPVYDVLLDRDLIALARADILPAAQVAVGVELITAADVLVYFGDLNDLLRAFSQLSSPESVLVFSCERATPDEAPNGWRIRPSGRFAHTRDYVLETARAMGGYRLVAYEEIVPRMEYGKPVQGHMFVMAR